MAARRPRTPTKTSDLRKRRWSRVTNDAEVAMNIEPITVTAPFRVPALPHPTRNPTVFDRFWLRAWLLPFGDCVRSK